MSPEKGQYDYGVDVQVLPNLSDRELADIGISRCDIHVSLEGNRDSKPSSDYREFPHQFLKGIKHQGKGRTDQISGRRP